MIMKTRDGEALFEGVQYIDETGFHNDLTDVFDSEIIVKADFVPNSTFDVERRPRML